MAARSRRAGGSPPTRGEPLTNMRSGFTSCSSSKAIRAATSSAVIIATVVPRALHNLEVLAAKYFHVEPLVAGQGKAAWPIALDVDEPQNVGADRAFNAIAAHAKHPGDLIVIDFGTATTFDVVDFDRRLQGRDHCAGYQPVARRAGQCGRQAAAHRHRSARRRSLGDRPHDREPDADRHLLGLCRDDRRA